MASSPDHPSFQLEIPDPGCWHQLGSSAQQHRQSRRHGRQSTSGCCPPPCKRIRTTYHEHHEHEHDHQHGGGQETTTTSLCCPLLGNTSQEEEVEAVEEAFDLESELELLLHELSSSSNARSAAASPPFYFSSSSSSSSSSFSSDEPAASLPLSFSPPFLFLEAPSSMSSPSSSGASSPARASFSGAPASAPTGGATVRVCLSHKPRGSGGSYVPLAPQQHIRVTKGKGKRLRLAVECDRQFEWDHLQLNLVDDATGASCNDHFTIWNHKSAIEDDEEAGGTRAEVEVTVNKLSPQLHFQVVIDHASTNREEAAAWTGRGHSTSFGTHNNGKDRSVRALRKQRKEALRAAAAAAARDRKLRNKARSSSRP